MKGLFDSMLGNTIGLKIDTSFEMNPAVRSDRLTSKFSANRRSHHEGLPGPAVHGFRSTAFGPGQAGSSSLDTRGRSLDVRGALDSKDSDDGQGESVHELIDNDVRQEVGEHRSRPSTRNSQGSISASWLTDEDGRPTFGRHADLNKDI